jgi:hypothetical protein
MEEDKKKQEFDLDFSPQAMIRNERQYRITKAQVDEFDRRARSLSETPPPGVHPRILQAQRDAIQSQLEELREGLAAYEALQRGAEPEKTE